MRRNGREPGKCELMTQSVLLDDKQFQLWHFCLNRKREIPHLWSYIHPFPSSQTWYQLNTTTSHTTAFTH